MKLLNGGTIGASIPQPGKSIDVEPQGCIRIEMAKKHTHNDVILTDDEAYQFCREVMSLLSLKERAAYTESKRAVQEIADSIAAEEEAELTRQEVEAATDSGVDFSEGDSNDADDYGVYTLHGIEVVEPANETA